MACLVLQGVSPMRSLAPTLAFRLLALTLSASAASGCTLDLTTPAAELSVDGQALTDSESRLSHVGQAARSALDAFPHQQGELWNLRLDTGVDADWVVQTPPENHWGAPEAALQNPTCRTTCDPDFGLQRCATQADCTDGGTCRPVQATVSRPDDVPQSLCAGHSDVMYDRLYLGIIGAERFVDIVSLTPQDERFEAAIRNAITYLSAKQIAIDVRMLYGTVIGTSTNTDRVLASATRDLGPTSRLSVYAGGYRRGLSSWNHAKIIAVDGEWMMQGGHNMWSRDYLKRSPVHDLSMVVRGSVAEDGHRMADALWRYTCRNPWFWQGSTERSAFPAGAADCPPNYVPHPAEGGTAGVPTLSLGRLGALGEDPADVALVAALDSARSILKLSLQDLGPLKVAGVALADWPEPVLGALARAMVRGVDIHLALSSPGAAPDGKNALSGGYGNGWTTGDVADNIADWLYEHPEELAPGQSVRAVLCDRLHIGTLRFNDLQERFADGSGISNHAKFFIVDDVAFYLGSQNLYDADLAEFGLLIDDPDVTADVLEQYWEPLWRHSERTIIAGRTADSCAL